jgi:signal transduction histidine kinase
MQIKFFTPKVRLLLVAYLMVAAITAVDFITGYEASSSILYLIPIYYLASSRLSSKVSVLTIAFVSTLAWLLVDFSTDHPYSSQWILVWNTLVRAGIFFSMALAVRALTQKSIKLSRANEQLQHLNAEKNKYIGIAAHDLRSPVGNIYNLSELLLDTKSSTNFTVVQKEFISLIRQISHNALSLLDNLLDVAQIEAGTLRVRKEEHDYISFVEETVRLNQLMADKKEQKLLLESEVPQLLLTFDPSYMGQVLNNLLTNAMKFSFAKTEVRVRISLQDNYVKTEVTDQGMGIQEQDRDKIFSPFEKARNVPTGGERSSGLGLAIVRKIIEAHQGEIGFSSTYGQGSTFYFFLPLQPE